MKRTVLAFLLGIVFSANGFGQTIEEGKKFLYYERNKSALELFQKIATANPGDAVSIYWLGQAYIAGDDLKAAKNLYEQAQQKGINDPFITVGLGHIDVLEKNIETAKEKFEKALEASKSKKGIYNTDILIAVGRANADGNNKIGDAPYAVEKLKVAALQDTKNPEPELLLGICYLKMGREFGTDAVVSFREATLRNPAYAKAYYRVGRIFQLQKSYDLMSEEFDKAIKADPAFPLTYLAYFLHYQYRDVNLAKENLDKYVANSDKDCNSDYYVADYLYRAGKFNESLDKVKMMEAGDCKDFVRLNILYAYNYDKLNDTANAKNYLEKYFASMAADKITPADYEFAAKFYAKNAGNEMQAISYYSQAAELSAGKNEKIDFINSAAKIAADARLFAEQIKLLTKISALKGGMQENDYYSLSKAAIDAKEWVLADSLSKAYVNAFPDKPQGYGFRVMIAKAQDTDTSKGLAVEPINLYNELLLKDAEKNKKAIYSNYYYLLIYYAQKAGDLKTAIAITGRMMDLYKEGEEYNFAKTINEQLTKKAGKGQK
ncbi:MAG: tetratricopeptide repeat protein [Sphingobacteriales bacterium]